MLNQVGRAESLAATVAVVVPCAPPSVPSSRMLEEPGTNAEACWSTWTGFGFGPLYPHVTSYHDVPVRSASHTSNVEKKTRSALFGSTVTAWSYQFCP